MARLGKGLRAYPRLTVGLALLGVLVALSLLAPWLSGHNPTAQHLTAVFKGPSSVYPLGTDQLGRDLLSRALYGGRLALAVAIGAIVGSLVIGVVLGIVSGYLGRITDSVIMRTMDGVMVFPELVLALFIIYALGASFWTVVAAITVVNVPRFARVVRAQVLSLREREFIASCVVAGASTPRILFRHLLPNVVDVMVVQAALTGGVAIFTAASLSFLGLGLPPPTPNWGGMLREGYSYLQVSPLLALIPGCFIFAAMLSFNLIGDGLRDLFDPRVGPKRKGSGWRRRGGRRYGPWRGSLVRPPC
ncbi:MAG: ABC transporter permease subunit [Propionibacteriales bacterium]|nr:ABC transporter permease subunit [Propionibacteriales bacterium]